MHHTIYIILISVHDNTNKQTLQLLQLVAPSITCTQFSVATAHNSLVTQHNKQQYSAVATRWLYCVECPQYSTRRRSASNIYIVPVCYVKQIGMEKPSNIISFHRKMFSIITNIPLIIS